MESGPSLNSPGSIAEDVYRDRVPGMRRKFTLQGDRLIIEGRHIRQGQFRLPVSLLTVDPEYGISRRRSEVWGPAGFILGSVFTLCTLSSIFSPLHGKMSPEVVAMAAGPAVVCFCIGIVNLPSVEYYSFQGIGGGIAFEIARRGPDRERFEQFVGRVVERIKLAQATGPGGAKLK
jgi:hypothetical protein